MKTKLIRLVTGVTGMVILCLLTQLAVGDEVSKIAKNELRAQLDNPDVIIVDLRKGYDWKGSEFKIKGAVRENPDAFNSWADKYPRDKTLVFYCA